MSFVITTRSYRSRNDLQSISTRVVFPDPTGPPTPTRSGGFCFVRRELMIAFCAWDSMPFITVDFEPNNEKGKIKFGNKIKTETAGNIGLHGVLTEFPGEGRRWRLPPARYRWP